MEEEFRTTSNAVVAFVTAAVSVCVCIVRRLTKKYENVKVY